MLMIMIICLQQRGYFNNYDIIFLETNSALVLAFEGELKFVNYVLSNCVQIYINILRNILVTRYLINFVSLTF